MDTLLIFFALPLATIIISIALQKIFRNPLLVAAIIFAIFLIVTFIIGDLNFLIATIVYTIIAFITSTLIQLICRLIRCFKRQCNNNGNESDRESENDNSENSWSCNNNQNGISTRINIIPNSNTNDRMYRTYSRYRR